MVQTQKSQVCRLSAVPIRPQGDWPPAVGAPFPTRRAPAAPPVRRWFIAPGARIASSAPWVLGDEKPRPFQEGGRRAQPQLDLTPTTETTTTETTTIDMKGIRNAEPQLELIDDRSTSAAPGDRRVWRQVAGRIRAPRTTPGSHSCGDVVIRRSPSRTGSGCAEDAPAEDATAIRTVLRPPRLAA